MDNDKLRALQTKLQTAQADHDGRLQTAQDAENKQLQLIEQGIGSKRQDPSIKVLRRKAAVNRERAAELARIIETLENRISAELQHRQSQHAADQGKGLLLDAGAVVDDIHALIKLGAHYRTLAADIERRLGTFRALAEHKSKHDDVDLQHITAALRKALSQRPFDSPVERWARDNITAEAIRGLNALDAAHAGRRTMPSKKKIRNPDNVQGPRPASFHRPQGPQPPVEFDKMRRDTKPDPRIVEFSRPQFAAV